MVIYKDYWNYLKILFLLIACSLNNPLKLIPSKHFLLNHICDIGCQPEIFPLSQLNLKPDSWLGPEQPHVPTTLHLLILPPLFMSFFMEYHLKEGRSNSLGTNCNQKLVIKIRYFGLKRDLMTSLIRLRFICLPKPDLFLPIDIHGHFYLAITFIFE